MNPQAIVKVLLKNHNDWTSQQEELLKDFLKQDQLYLDTQTLYGPEGCKDFINRIDFNQFKVSKIFQQSKELHWIYILWGRVLIDNKEHCSSFSMILRQECQIIPYYNSAIMTLSKQNFKKIEINYKNRMILKEINRIHLLPYFGSLDKKQLKIFHSLIKKKIFYINNYVYRQGERAEKLYIINSGSFIMRKRYKNKGKDVILMVESDMFGQQCLKYTINSDNNQIILESTYISDVICNCSQATVFQINLDQFLCYPLQKYQLPNKIYSLYQSRRQQISNINLKVDRIQNRVKQQNKADIMSQYLQKLYKTNKDYGYIKKNLNNATPYFFNKQQFNSMKLKLKYENVLKKVQKMNRLSNTTVFIEKQKKTYSNINGLERRAMLSQLRAKLQKREKNKKTQILTSMMIRSQILKTQRTDRRNQKSFSSTQRLKNLTTQRRQFQQKSHRRIRTQSSKQFII